MTFYDQKLGTYITIDKINDEYTATVNGETFTVPVNEDWMKSYPDWIIRDIVQILVRKQIRKQSLNRIASSIIKKES